MMYRTKKILGLAALLFAQTSASALYPSSLTTQKGSASDVALSALQTKDLSGSQDNWNKYVEFYGSDEAYEGTFTFDASSVQASSVGQVTLNVNFRGPKKSDQTWSFELLDTASNTWVAVGDNSDASDWKWSSLSFNVGEAFSSFVSNGQVQLRMTSTKGDDADLDYLELDLAAASTASEGASSDGTNAEGHHGSSSSGHNTEAPTEAPTKKPTQAPTEAPTKKPTSSGHNTQAPTAKATEKPTSAPTAKATEKPTSAPTAKATSAPTSKATSAPTSKPTTKPTSAPTSKPSTTTGSTSGSSASGRVCPSGSHYQPGPQTSWQWQLQGTIDTSVDVQIYDIDMFDSSESLISTLHSQGRAVVCYIDTAYEPGRPDSSDFTAAVLGAGIDGWPGQKWVDIRSSVVRNIMTNRMAMAASKGCDAVEMDDVDSYENDPGFPLTAADQIDFNTFLATTAHSYDLGIALKNDIDQVTQLAPNFDFAINEQCFQYDECTAYSSAFINQGKAVLGVEYDLATSAFCTKANADNFSWLKKDLDLDASRTACCTTCSGTHTCVPTNSARSVREAREQELVNEVLAEEEAVAAEPEAVETNNNFASSAAKISGVASVVVATLFWALF